MLKYTIKNQRTGITQKLNAEMYWWIEMLFKIDNYFLVFLITDIFPLSVQMQYTLSVDPSGWGMDVVLTCYLKSSFPHEWKVLNGRAHWLETDANPERCVGEGLQHILIQQSYIPNLRDPACMRIKQCLCNLSFAPLPKLQWFSC